MEKAEHILISQYSASELAGALMLGEAARKTSDPYLRSKYTWHSYEEARHAWLWMELLDKENLPSFEVHDRDGDQYFSYYKEVQDDIDFLAFVHVYEIRVPYHLEINAKMTNLTQPTRALMRQLIIEEGPHLSWIAEYLKKQRDNGNTKVAKAVQKFGDIEAKTYQDHIVKLQSLTGDFKELGDLLAEGSKDYGCPWKSFLA